LFATTYDAILCVTRRTRPERMRAAAAAPRTSVLRRLVCAVDSPGDGDRAAEPWPSASWVQLPLLSPINLPASGRFGLPERLYLSLRDASDVASIAFSMPLL